eukprot:3176821-Pyramimonas_sp.AAC.1
MQPRELQETFSPDESAREDAAWNALVGAGAVELGNGFFRARKTIPSALALGKRAKRPGTQDN